MARPAWLQHKECGSMFWLQIMRTLSLWLGRGASRPILYLIAAYFLVSARAARQASRHYLGLVHGQPARWQQCFAHFLTFATTIHDRVYLLNNRFDDFDIRITGNDILHDTLATHTGAFLFGGHMGSFEVLRAAARREAGLQVCLVMYKENAQRINAALAAINPDSVPEVIALGDLDSMLRVSQRLDQGALVGVLADRSIAEDACRAVRLFGQTAYLPLSPFRMAALLKRPVIFMAGLYRGGNRYDLHFELLADFAQVSRSERAAAIDAAVDRYACMLETYCRIAPSNWFNYFDFWSTTAHAQS